LFCTSEAFPKEVANTILRLFNQEELVSIVEPRPKNLFGVVGKINVNYDPFDQSSMQWGDLLAKMTYTLDVLEDKIRPFLTNEWVISNTLQQSPDKRL